jgi:predicted RNase H-like nuclease (RuvC/YqgF family)
MRKGKEDVKKNKCGKSTFPDKETSDKYIEIKREKIGAKFQELRSYKCLECKQWHHTSNLTPIYKKRIEDLENEVTGLKQELKAKDKALETIKRTIYNIAPKGDYKKQIAELKILLEQKANMMTEFKKALAKALGELSKYNVTE